MTPEPEFFYVIFSDAWPFRSGHGVNTSAPAAVGDEFEITFRSDVADHRVTIQVLRIVHCQIGASGGINVGCHLHCRTSSHRADPVGSIEGLALEPDRIIRYLPRPPRRRGPRLRVVRDSGEVES